MENKCGTCTACCRVFAIPEFDKPAGKWCEHCEIGKSCKIYATRPERCVEYECYWLMSQSKPGNELVPELRPDRCKVVFSPTTNGYIMMAIIMHKGSDAWKSKRVLELIRRLNRAGMSVAVGPPMSETQLMLKPDGTHRIVHMTPPDKDGMQWNID